MFLLLLLLLLSLLELRLEDVNVVIDSYGSWEEELIIEDLFYLESKLMVKEEMQPKAEDDDLLQSERRIEKCET